MTQKYPTAERCGEHLREVRKQLGMTQGDVAKKAGFTTQQICSVEKGTINTPIETLTRIAQCLNISLNDLFGDDVYGHITPSVKDESLGEIGSPPFIATIIGGRIRQARKAIQLKQDVLASKVGYSSRAAIAQIENGLALPSVDKALAIARTLNVRIGWLLGDEEEMEVEQRQIPEWIKEKIRSIRNQLATLTHELDDLLLHG